MVLPQVRLLIRSRGIKPGTWLRGPLASFASQATGLVQLGLLLSHGGATRATDAYFYLFSLGLTPTLILLYGLMYPLLLNEQQVSRAGLRRIRTSGPVLSAVFVVAGCGWLRLRGRLDDDMLPLIVLLAGNAVVQNRLLFRAVAAEAGGSALWISGVALPANLAACTVLLIPWKTSLSSAVAMVAALLIGNSIFLMLTARRGVGRGVLDEAPVEPATRGGGLWFLSKASIGYASQITLSSLAVLLPASNVTFLSLASKIVGAVSTGLANAIMPVFVHRLTATPTAARKFLRVLPALLAVIGLVGITLVGLLKPSITVAALIVAIWIVTSSAAVVSQRMAFRFLPANASRFSMIAMAAIVGLALASSSARAFDLDALLCAYAALDGVSAGLLLRAMKDVTMTLVLAFALIGIVAIWVTTLV